MTFIRFSVDMTAASPAVYGPLVPSGTYRFQIVSAEILPSPNWRPMLRIQAEIIEGEHAGRCVRQTYSDHPRGRFRTRPFLRALGLKPRCTRIADLSVQAVVAKEFVADVIVTEWDDRQVNRLENERPPEPDARRAETGRRRQRRL
jgi:hypothetical protein